LNAWILQKCIQAHLVQVFCFRFYKVCRWKEGEVEGGGERGERGIIV